MNSSGISTIRLLLWLTALAGLLTGSSYFSTPEHELTCGARFFLPTKCGDSSCRVSYIVDVGSTGKKPETNVVVELGLRPDTEFIKPLKVTNAGGAIQPFTVRNGESTMFVEIPEVPTTSWLEISFEILVPDRAGVIPLPSMVSAASSDTSTAVEGSPGGTRFIRALLRIFDGLF